MFELFGTACSENAQLCSNAAGSWSKAEARRYRIGGAVDEARPGVAGTMISVRLPSGS
jgi:hypothetical protein